MYKILIPYAIIALCAEILIITLAKKRNQPTPPIYMLLVALFAPIILVYSVYQLLRTIRYKNRPMPITGKQKKYIKVDCIVDSSTNKIISIEEYNLLHNTSFSLDDVYGKGYLSNIPQSELEEFTKAEDFNNKYIIDDNLVEEAYKEFCIAFVKARNSNDYSEVEDFIDKDIVFIRYKKGILKGREQFINYWKDRWEHLVNASIAIESHIKQCNAWGHISVEDRKKDGASTYLLIYFDKGKVVKAIIAPNPLQDPMVRLCSLDDTVDKWEDMEILDNMPGQSLRLFCPCCGMNSENMDWHNFKARKGSLGFSGEVSVCPNCKSKVEIYPKILMRYSVPN